MLSEAQPQQSRVGRPALIDKLYSCSISDPPVDSTQAKRSSKACRSAFTKPGQMICGWHKQQTGGQHAPAAQR